MKHGEAIYPKYDYKNVNGNICLHGLRYGQATDILFDLSDFELEEAKLVVTFQTVYRGKFEPPEMVELKMEKCSVSENLDHEFRFKTIDFFK